MPFNMKEKFKMVDDMLLIHSNKLAKCRGAHQEEDHDKLIVAEKDIEIIEKDIVGVHENILTNKQSIEKTVNKFIELTGAINEVTDKLFLIDSVSLRKTKFFYAIATGIIILVVGAFIIWSTKIIVDDLRQENTEVKHISNELLLNEIRSLKNGKEMMRKKIK